MAHSIYLPVFSYKLIIIYILSYFGRISSTTNQLITLRSSV